MKLQNCINFLLSRAQQSVTQSFKERLAPYEITPVQYAVLKCLWDDNGLAPKQLAVILGLDSPAITGVLDRLENKGLIIRTPDANDRRALQVFLTEKAAALEKPINHVIEEADAYVLRNFSDTEIKDFKETLAKITQIS